MRLHRRGQPRVSPQVRGPLNFLHMVKWLITRLRRQKAWPKPSYTKVVTFRRLFKRSSFLWPARVWWMTGNIEIRQPSYAKVVTFRRLFKRSSFSLTCKSLMNDRQYQNPPTIICKSCTITTTIQKVVVSLTCKSLKNDRQYQNPPTVCLPPSLPPQA